MPKRRLPFVTNYYYHIFNRGLAKRPIFMDKRDYEKFIFTLFYYRFTKLPMKLSHFLQISNSARQNIISKLTTTGTKNIDILCFVLMPNHFHLLLKQVVDNGISNYLRLISNSWTHYFNLKYNRQGALFQGIFKAVMIEDDKQLIHLSRYIHINPVVSNIIKEKDFLKYQWSSFNDYLKRTSHFVDVETIFSHFSKPISYKNFVLNQIDYGKKLEGIKHLLLE